MITKDHVQDLQGIQTPGIGKYDSTGSLKLRTMSPRTTIGNFKRFHEAKSFLEYMRSVPPNYPVERLKELRAQAVIGTELRFKESPEKTPGPADYNTLNYKSIQKEVLSRTTSSFNKTMTMQSRWNRSTFGHPHSNYDKVWFEENDKQFKNVEGPGPGYYELTDDRPRKKKSMFSFGKATRNMSGIDKKTKE